MPTLADIYSAINTFKRKSSDFVQNPGTSLEQMLFAANENAREFNKKHALATDYTIAQARGQQPTPEQTQAEMGLRNTLSEAYSPGMTVWHGSPHVFERFDLGKIGTGEGAQSYGSGMYVAQNPAVAKEYREKLSSTGSAKNLASKFGGIDQGIAEAQRRIAHYQNLIAEGGGGAIDRAKSFLQISEKNLNDLNALKQGLPENTGAFYKVDLPDTHIRRMLDWDSPIKDQPTPVRKLAKALGLDMNDLGGDLLAKVGKDEAGRKVLQDAGIRGIKYLDEKSRYSPYEVSLSVKGKPYASSQFVTKEQAERYAAEKQIEGFDAKHRNVGTKNFVVFDPSHMTILERNQQALNK
jgi:hypothetical protein